MRKDGCVDWAVEAGPGELGVAGADLRLQRLWVGGVAGCGDRWARLVITLPALRACRSGAVGSDLS